MNLNSKYVQPGVLKMAKFIIEFEDNEDGGMNSKIELIGFKGVKGLNVETNSCTQNMYFAINNFLVSEIGLSIPEVNKAS
jgi:hypothetical protein